MERFWVKTRPSVDPTPLNMGIGVTAASEADARLLIRLHFGDEVVVENVTVIADMAEIDQDHVVPNMGNHMVRGVWWPRQT
ncbi:MAG: hypothetical protein ACXU8Z_10745 [Caulobacteraceae bacterium]